jgi:magnesium chelatase family protein
VVRLDGRADAELHRAYKYGWLSARGRHRVLRVARTIADLAGRQRVSREDILLALSLRQRTGPELAEAA